MPIIQSAKKKVRQDKKKTKFNKKYESTFKKVVGSFKKSLSAKSKPAQNKLYSALDRAVKKGVIHKKKASRLKSRLSQLHKRKK